MVGLLYTFPDHYDSFFFGLNPLGMHQFQSHFGLGWIPRLGFRGYSRTFRLLLILLWSGYALTLLACLRGARLRQKPLLLSVGVLGFAIALFAPPLLSTDTYAYAAHGRIFVLYGHNPYLWLPAGLLEVHDSSAPFLVWNETTVYGPLWTWLEIFIAAVLKPYGIWSEVIAFKLLGASALLAAALAGRRIAARFSPGSENLTFLAIGLNPLFLLEGPCSGHNDFVLISLLLLGAMSYLDRKYVVAALLLGLSIGIKPITLALLPWVLLDYCRGRSWSQRVAGVALGSALVALPVFLLFAPLWAGPATLAGMQHRTTYQQSPADLSAALQLKLWLATHGVKPLLAAAVITIYQKWMLFALYGTLSLWVWKSKNTASWLTAWAIFSAALMFLFLKPAFPWYIAWFWPVCLLRWDRWHLTLSAACLGLSLALTWGYGLVSFSPESKVHNWITKAPISSTHTPRLADIRQRGPLPVYKARC